MKRRVALCSAVVALLIVFCETLPAAARPLARLLRLPYTARSMVVEYETGGTSRVTRYITSYQGRRGEVVLSTTIPGRPVLTFCRRILDGTGFLFSAVREIPRGDDSLTRNCGAGFSAADQANALGHKTLVLHNDGNDLRTTVWVAPELGCLPVKIAVEQRQADGKMAMVQVRRVLSIDKNY